MRKVLFVLFALFFLLPWALFSQAIIIDHNCTDISKIPSSWISAARNQLRCSYGHTSHGSQLITGMTVLENDSAYGSDYAFNTSGAVTAGVLSIADRVPYGDLGNPDRVTWEARTREYLNGTGSDRNVVMWSWCGQVSNASAADINTYLTLMDGLEDDYPNVTFVYMTGHLNGTGSAGNTHLRNEQIRAFCRDNNKILFDFADIESYDPDGTCYLDLGGDDGLYYNGGNWGDQWVAANPSHEWTRLTNSCGSCAHSMPLNCILKGNAAWWLMARIAGWNGSTTTQPSITVTSPNGGEDWIVASSHTITWTSTGSIASVQIQYSTNNGGSWTTITSSTNNDGSYSWTVPDAPSTQCLVRVRDTDGSPSDTSNGNFSISAAAAPSITVTSPNGGENWTVGSSHNITWTSTGSITDVQIQYSTNSGGSWTTITASTSNDGSYSWTIPDANSSHCLVRVRDTDGSPSDTGNNTFTISPPAAETITVTSPNGGECWTVGSTHNITWTSTGSITEVQIHYSIDNGSNWKLISASTPNDGSYSWVVPGTTTSECLVRVRDTDNSPSDTSNATFCITSQASATITVQSPKGGERWKSYSTQKIKWQSTGSVVNVKIEYTIDNGGSWSSIIDSTENDGCHSWTVPGTTSDQCLVRISDTEGSASDTSDAVFSIYASGDPSLTIKSPNGGEKWKVGSSQKIKWTSTGDVGPLTLEYSTDNGANYVKIASSTPNDGKYSWTIPDAVSSQCIVRIYETEDTNPSDVSDGVFSITADTNPPKPPTIRLNRKRLNFCCITGKQLPHSQKVFIWNAGEGTLHWTASADAEWIKPSPVSGTGAGCLFVSVDPSGLAEGDYSGTLEVSDPDAENSPQQVTVHLKVKTPAQDHPPIGSFDTPLNGITCSGSIAVTGWVLDDVDLENVKIYYKKGGNLKYVGDAILVEGARTDIETDYPDYPCNYEAGWGYMMLTHFLPNQGNGTFEFHAIARDSLGKTTTLGTKTVVIDNDDREQPFGAIDTPFQGGEAYGSGFVNYGWALTPMPGAIPENGSTIDVYVDGVNLGHPVYNNYREDIAEAFPGYANSDGAVGYFTINTTAYENGIHTIAWIVTDNKGNSDGIGSRYFNIQNSQDAGSTKTQGAGLKGGFIWSPASPPGTLHRTSIDRAAPVDVITGFGRNAQPVTLCPDINGIVTVETDGLGRIEIRLAPETANTRYTGCHVVGNEFRPLPIGSTLDRENGIFYWQPGPGFQGEFRLVFGAVAETGETLGTREILVRIE
jgi:hypothetical protein